MWKRREEKRRDKVIVAGRGGEAQIAVSRRRAHTHITSAVGIHCTLHKGNRWHG